MILCVGFPTYHINTDSLEVLNKFKTLMIGRSNRLSNCNKEH